MSPVALGAIGLGASVALLTGRGGDELVPTAHASSGPSEVARVLAREERDANRPTPPVPAPFPNDPRSVDSFGRAFADGRVITGATPHRLILFTFDDGPSHRYTLHLLDYLDAYGVRAVFFLIGERLVGSTPRQVVQQNIAREIVRRGHIVGNHTTDHVQLPVLDDAGVRAQLQVTEDAFVAVLGARPWLLRPPGGSRSVRVDNLVASQGYTQVLWNLGAGDFQVSTPEEVFDVWKRVFERRERENGDRGGIILLHDIHEHSVEAFPLIVEELRRRNCALLESGEELYDIVDDPRFFFEARADASASAEAAPASPAATELAARQARLRVETAQFCREAR